MQQQISALCQPKNLQYAKGSEREDYKWENMVVNNWQF